MRCDEMARLRLRQKRRATNLPTQPQRQLVLQDRIKSFVEVNSFPAQKGHSRASFCRRCWCCWTRCRLVAPLRFADQLFSVFPDFDGRLLRCGASSTWHYTRRHLHRMAARTKGRVKDSIRMCLCLPDDALHMYQVALVWRSDHGLGSV